MVGNKYTYEITTAAYAKEHALHCLNMRSDDLVELGEALNVDILNNVKHIIQNAPDVVFILPYDNNKLVNNVGVAKRVGDSGIRILQGISAPQDGNMSYVYGSIFLGLLQFLAREGYTTYHTECLIGHNAHKLYEYYSETFTEYNFDFQEEADGKFVKLVIDLVNLKG